MRVWLKTNNSVFPYSLSFSLGLWFSHGKHPSHFALLIKAQREPLAALFNNEEKRDAFAAVTYFA
jgi:hypothetical protein